MVLTVTVLLALTAFVTTIVSAIGKCPLWVPVLVLCVLHLLMALPR
jgi:hypothetical protein